MIIGSNDICESFYDVIANKSKKLNIFFQAKGRKLI